MYEPVAIVGCGCLYPPNSFSLNELFKNVMNGIEGIREIDKSFWEPEKYYNPDHSVPDKTYCKQSGYLDSFHVPVELLAKMRMSEEIFASFNRTQKMVLHTILQALSSARYSLEDIKNAGLFIGNMLGDPVISDYILYKHGEVYQKLAAKKLMNKNLSAKLNSWSELFDKELKKKFHVSGNLNKSIFPSTLASEVADALNMTQLSMVVDGACSGGLIVIDEAIKCLHQNKVDLCVVTGVLGNMGVSGNVAFSKIGGLSEKASRPLDKTAGGLTPGEGAGSIIIKRLSDALRDRNTVFGVIRGSGVASDGAGQSIYAPNSRGQHNAMRKSLDRAHMTMQDIDYVEMHATGTPVGDKVEVKSIIQLCKEDAIQKPVAIGSVKAQIGHSFSGAGMANLFKVLLAMQNEVLPPTHGFTGLPGELGDVSDYVYVNDKTKEWPNPKGHPRRALINAFGFGGINANVLLEEFELDYHQKLLLKLNQDIRTCTPAPKYAVISYGYFEEENNANTSWGNRPDESNADDNGAFVFPFIKFKIPPRILNKLDESQRISLLAVSKALERAQINLPKQKTGVFAGGILGLKNAYCSDLRIRSVEYTSILKGILGDTLSDKEYQDLEKEFKADFEPIEEDTLPGFMDNIVAGRIANYFDTQGSNAMYDMDIGSFAAALHQGLLSLNNGENDLIIAGAVNCNDLDAFCQVYNAAGSHSIKFRKGACYFIIKREEDVQSEDKVYAYITAPRFGKTTLRQYSSNDMDYLGATEAFALLDNIFKSIEQTKCIQHTSASLSGRSFTYNIIPPTLADSFLIPDKYFTLYTDAADLSHLINFLGNVYSHKKIPESNIDGQSQAAIIFKDYEDLAEQISFLKKINQM